MDIKMVLMGVQITLSVILLASIMPQETKNKPASQLGGGEGSQAYFKPKGKEVFLARMTKISATLLFVNAIAMLVIK